VRSAAGRFTPLQSVLHWLMATMILAMLFVGIGMVSTLSPRYWTLVSLHKPLGILILVLVLLRLGVRCWRGAPALPSDLPNWQASAAKGSHVLLYMLMIAMPLVGWSMLSAGGYPVVLYGPVHLPPIMPHDDALYAILRNAHTWLARVLFMVIQLHVSAALFHALIRRDGVLASVLPRGRKKATSTVRAVLERRS
jgi:cytochrome b561